MEEKTTDRELSLDRIDMDRRAFDRYLRMLSLNYRIILPLLSALPPAAAYRVIRLTGLFGKPRALHTSFLYNRAAAPIGMDNLMKYGAVDDPSARGVMEAFFRYETRIQAENIWMARNRTGCLPAIMDADAVGRLAAVMRDHGPLILLSAHTFNYVALLWALHAAGAKVCFMMVDPSAAKTANGVLQQTVIDSTAVLSRMMPIIFTNEGNSVARSIELMRQGYSVLMHLDVPGYRERGVAVQLLGRTFWVPSGCLRIFGETGARVAFACSYATGLTRPYGLSFRQLDISSGTIDLGGWAAALDEVVRMSPESWLGWLYLQGMA